MKKALTIGFSGAAIAAAVSFAATSLKTESPVVGEAQATEAASETAPIVLAQVMNYERGPRIIIVPPSPDRRDYGSVERGNRASVDRSIDEEDHDIAPRRTAVPPAPVRTTPRWGSRPETPRLEIAPQRAEKPVKPLPEARPEIRTDLPRKVRQIDMSKPKAKGETKEEVDVPIPQPPSPRRAVLSAPPPPAEGPTPIKPTPKFGPSALGAKAEAAKPIEKPADTSAEPANDSPPPGEITADQPPPGYTPPQGMLRDEAGNRY